MPKKKFDFTPTQIEELRVFAKEKTLREIMERYKLDRHQAKYIMDKYKIEYHKRRTFKLTPEVAAEKELEGEFEINVTRVKNDLMKFKYDYQHFSDKFNLNCDKLDSMIDNVIDWSKNLNNKCYPIDKEFKWNE